MRSNKRKRADHPHRKSDSNSLNSKISMQDQPLKENDDDFDRKHHHHKKNNLFDDLNILEGLTLLLLFKEIGLIDDKLEADEYKDFDVNNLNEHNKNTKSEIHETDNENDIKEKPDSKFDLDFFNDDNYME